MPANSHIVVEHNKARSSNRTIEVNKGKGKERVKASQGARNWTVGAISKTRPFLAGMEKGGAEGREGCPEERTKAT